MPFRRSSRLLSLIVPSLLFVGCLALPADRSDDDDDGSSGSGGVASGDSQCFNEPVACTLITDSYSCFMQDGCDWDTYWDDCTGVQWSCDMYWDNKGLCLTQLGCQWQNEDGSVESASHGDSSGSTTPSSGSGMGPGAGGSGGWDGMGGSDNPDPSGGGVGGAAVGGGGPGMGGSSDPGMGGGAPTPP